MDIGNDIRQAVTKYSDMLYRICIVILCNEQDVQDAIQDTFCRYLEKAPDFHDEEHEKAWLLRTTLNRAGDLCRRRRDDACLDAAESVAAEAPDYGPLLSAVRSLPQAYSAVIHLYYYEGYSIKEIARLLALPAPTVGTRLSRGRERLRKLLKEEEA